MLNTVVRYDDDDGDDDDGDEFNALQILGRICRMSSSDQTRSTHQKYTNV